MALSVAYGFAKNLAHPKAEKSKSKDEEEGLLRGGMESSDESSGAMAGMAMCMLCCIILPIGVCGFVSFVYGIVFLSNDKSVTKDCGDEGKVLWDFCLYAYYVVGIIVGCCTSTTAGGGEAAQRMKNGQGADPKVFMYQLIMSSPIWMAGFWVLKQAADAKGGCAHLSDTNLYLWCQFQVYFGVSAFGLFVPAIACTSKNSGGAQQVG